MSIFGRNAVGDVALIHHALVVFTTFFAEETQSHQELITTLPEPPGVEERIGEGVKDTHWNAGVDWNLLWWKSQLYMHESDIAKC